MSDYRSHNHGHRRKRLYPLLAIGVGFVAAGAIAEAAARIAKLDSNEIEITFAPDTTIRGHFDATRGWVNAKGQGENNLQGFRFPRDYDPESAVKNRVVLLGDSQVWGMGVEADEHTGFLLDKRIADAEVLPFGVPGYGPVQEWLLLREILENYPVDQVFAVAFVYNDLVDESVSLAYGGFQKPYLRETENGWQLYNVPAPRPVLSPETTSAVPFFGRKVQMDFLASIENLERISALYRTLVQHSSRQPALARLLEWFDLVKSVRTTATTSEFYSIRRIDGRSVPCWHLERCPQEHRLDGLRAVTAAYELMHQLCQEYGIPFSVVLTPSYEELDRDRFDVIDSLARPLKRMGIPVVDVRGDFRSQEDWHSVMGEDRHWTAKGHRLVADAIERHWLDRSR